MVTWIPYKAPVNERKRRRQKVNNKNEKSSDIVFGRTCKICGHEIKSGSLCPGCAEYIRSKREAERTGHDNT